MDLTTWERADPGSPSWRTGPRPPTVADELDVDGRARLRCPASGLVAAGLLARGVPAERGPVFARTAWDSREAGERETVLGADLGGGIGLAVAGGAAWQQAVRDVLTQWLSVAGERTVLLPFPRSFCAGVERAIGAVEQALARSDGPVYVRKQIVHNTHVVADLESRGAIFVDELDEVPAGATVVFSAHGVSPAVRQEAARLGLAAIDATCPLVTRVHAKARRFALRGDTVVLIGHAKHEEVEGVVGESPEAIAVVADPADVDALEVPDPDRVTYLTQTTLALDETADTVGALRARFPRLREPGAADICYATTNRQVSLAAVAEEADLVLVVGSANSSNSVRLVEVARRRGSPAYLIDSVADLRASWLAGVRTIGLTAGASAPPSLITAIVDAIAGLGPVRVEERQSAHESVHFALPSPVRSR
jgi:4-hydroxy-3-methylbut-2-en-1-yl diphosphate reductase